MDRGEAIARLKTARPSSAPRVQLLCVFYGSTARNEGAPDNDVGLVIDYGPKSAFNAIDLMGMKSFIEEQLQRPVDLISRNGLRPALRSRIEASVNRVF